MVLRWDLMPDVEGKEDLSNKTQQVLPPRTWNKDVEGAWRMDINIGIIEDAEEHESICDVGSDLIDNKPIGPTARKSVQGHFSYHL